MQKSRAKLAFYLSPLAAPLFAFIYLLFRGFPLFAFGALVCGVAISYATMLPLGGLAIWLLRRLKFFNAVAVFVLFSVIGAFVMWLLVGNNTINSKVLEFMGLGAAFGAINALAFCFIARLPWRFK